MSEPADRSNMEIAQIYENMMSGERSSLFRLQQIATSNHPKYIDTYNLKKQNSKQQPDEQQTSKVALSESKVEQTFKEVSSVPSMQIAKEKLFLNAIKKGVRIDAGASRNEKQRVQTKNFKRIINSSNEIYAAQMKKSLFKEAKVEKEVQFNNINLEKPPPSNNKVHALPRVHRTRQHIEIEAGKPQSIHMERQKKKVSLENIEKSKIVVKKQRVDFKQMIIKNKIMREEFQKRNEQQRELQMDIMKYHQQTKKHLEDIATRFQLKFNNVQRYLKRKQKIDNLPNTPQLKQSQSQKKISPFKAAMNNENQICTQINHEITHLQSLFNNNASKLKKLQRQSQSYLFVRYLNRYGSQIQEQAEEEADTVEPLQQQQQHQQEKNSRNRYKYSMARTREKKWGLIQRTEYEANRTHSLQESRQANTTSRTSQPTEDSPNKVTVNERLKNLLFS